MLIMRVVRTTLMCSYPKFLSLFYAHFLMKGSAEHLPVLFNFENIKRLVINYE